MIIYKKGYHYRTTCTVGGQQLAVYKKKIFYLLLKNEKTVDTAIMRQIVISVKRLPLFRKFILAYCVILFRYIYIYI